MNHKPQCNSFIRNKPENIILHLGTNGVPCKSGTNTLKDLIELKGFILERLRSHRKIKLLLTTIRTDKESEKNMLFKQPQNPISAQININSIMNKFQILVSLVTSHVDILMISETISTFNIHDCFSLYLCLSLSQKKIKLPLPLDCRQSKYFL